MDDFVARRDACLNTDGEIFAMMIWKVWSRSPLVNEEKGEPRMAVGGWEGRFFCHSPKLHGGCSVIRLIRGPTPSSRISNPIYAHQTQVRSPMIGFGPQITPPAVTAPYQENER